MNLRRILFAAALAALALAASSCRTAIVYRHPASPPVAETRVGPPPHAPAHGYRHRHADGTRLVYDSTMGVYVVLGHAEMYFSDGLYFRMGSTSWQASANPDSGWKPVSEKKVPPGLRKTYACKAQKRR
jgi:hypothetical protein